MTEQAPPEATRILVVDDTPENQRVLYEILEKAGFYVLISGSGEDALQTVQDRFPHLILLDILMPGMDGFEVCRRLKEDSRSRDIPVIFITALASVEDKVKGLSIGAQDYITKPFQRAELLARVRMHLEFTRLQQEALRHNQELTEEIRIRERVEASLEDTARQLHAQTLELKQRNAELDAFARTVAHDLKNPVSSLISLSRLVLKQLSRMEPPIAPNLLHYLELMCDASRQTYNIIDALLTLARMSREDIELQVLDMGAIVQRAQRRLAENLHSSGADLALPQSWPQAYGHAPWVEEIWFNYLSNAVKYGGTPPEIRISATRLESGTVVFSVHDNGPGLDAEARAKLFQPFVRLHQERAEGHGLGLSIVRQISEKLGGEAGVESAPGGSKFYFTLPGASVEA